MAGRSMDRWSRSLRGVLAVLATLAINWVCPVAAAGPEPTLRALPQAHSHNDYEQKRPLLEALDHGFCSVEADVYLVEG
ncbi:MAG: hypothetical protein ACKPAH_10035, partial [Verrucomicrobiota bacterium]